MATWFYEYPIFSFGIVSEKPILNTKKHQNVILGGGQVILQVLWMSAMLFVPLGSTLFFVLFGLGIFAELSVLYYANKHRAASLQATDVVNETREIILAKYEGLIERAKANGEFKPDISS